MTPSDRSAPKPLTCAPLPRPPWRSRAERKAGREREPCFAAGGEGGGEGRRAGSLRRLWPQKSRYRARQIISEPQSRIHPCSQSRETETGPASKTATPRQRATRPRATDRARPLSSGAGERESHFFALLRSQPFGKGRTSHQNTHERRGAAFLAFLGPHGAALAPAHCPPCRCPGGGVPRFAEGGPIGRAGSATDPSGARPHSVEPALPYPAARYAETMHLRFEQKSTQTIFTNSSCAAGVRPVSPPARTGALAALDSRSPGGGKGRAGQGPAPSPGPFNWLRRSAIALRGRGVRLGLRAGRGRSGCCCCRREPPSGLGRRRGCRCRSVGSSSMPQPRPCKVRSWDTRPPQCTNRARTRGTYWS
jgi:hypothetical protein